MPLTRTGDFSVVIGTTSLQAGLIAVSHSTRAARADLAASAPCNRSRLCSTCSTSSRSAAFSSPLASALTIASCSRVETGMTSLLRVSVSRRYRSSSLTTRR